MTDPLQAIYTAVRTHLMSVYVPWGNRAFVAPAPLTASRPLVVYSRQAMVDRRYQSKLAVEITLNVRAIADSAETGFNCRSVLVALLNNAGYQDNRTTYLNPDGWTVSTTKITNWLDSSDQIDNHLVFTAGFLLEIMMEQNT